MPRLTYLGHAAFTVEGSKARIVIDPFLSDNPLATVSPETDILKAAELFAERRFHHLPVLEQGRLVGQISRRNIMRAIQAMRYGK